MEYLVFAFSQNRLYLYVKNIPSSSKILTSCNYNRRGFCKAASSFCNGTVTITAVYIRGEMFSSNKIKGSQESVSPTTLKVLQNAPK